VRPLEREFYRRDPRAVAPDLLGKVVVAGERRARIVEVEAYCGPEDPAAHSYRGPTARNATMFGPPGHLYVYFSYGMHWCCNPVCGDDGEGVAVLLRALEPLEGLEVMRAGRGGGRDRDLCRGPARLCQALGITRDLDGADLVTGDRGVVIVDDGTPPPSPPAVGPRVGITRAADHPWRFWVPGSPYVSGPAGTSRRTPGCSGGSAADGGPPRPSPPAPRRPPPRRPGGRG
jgi:DNA-3-methyladenine glycosylase